MFQIGDAVVYGSEGVCRVTELQTREFNGQQMEYYVLTPVYRESSTVFVPCENEVLTARMHSVLGQDEAKAFIAQLPNLESIWINHENERKQVYRTILAEADRVGAARIIRTLYLHREKLNASGKKMHMSDERYFVDAQRMLFDELAFVLELEREQVLPLLMKTIEE